MTTPQPQPPPPPVVNYSDEYTFPQSNSTDRLAAMRPESLRSLNTNSPSPHHSHSHDANDLNEPLRALRGLVAAIQTTEVPAAAVIDALHSVIESLSAARITHPRENRHSRLFEHVNHALRRSASDFDNDTVSDRNLADVVEWISNIYLTPTRRHSTSSEPTGPISARIQHAQESVNDNQTLINNSIAEYVALLEERKTHRLLLDDAVDAVHNGPTSSHDKSQRDAADAPDDDDHSHLHPFTSPASRFSRTRHLSLSDIAESDRIGASNWARVYKMYFAVRVQTMSDPIKRILDNVGDWSKFDIFELNSHAAHRTLAVVAVHLAERFRLFDAFHIDREKFARFICAVEDGYRDVPYHNNVHAADVTANAFFLLSTTALAQSLTPLCLLASLIAAAVHDYNHPGTNNAFQVATQSEYAIRYNDRCVLESMHCAEAFFLMKRPGHDITSTMSTAITHELRALIIHMVLSTDMQNHFSHLADFNAELETKRMRASRFDVTDSADRLILLTTVIHTADLGNPCKPPHIYAEWNERVLEEFYRQGDLERAANLPVSLMMDRMKPNVERSQIGFIDVIVHPLWESIHKLCDEQVAPALTHLAVNRKEWANKLPPNTPTLSPNFNNNKLPTLQASTPVSTSAASSFSLSSTLSTPTSARNKSSAAASDTPPNEESASLSITIVDSSDVSKGATTADVINTR